MAGLSPVLEGIFQDEFPARFRFPTDAYALFRSGRRIAGAQQYREETTTADEKGDESEIVDAVRAQKEVIGGEDTTCNDKNESGAKTQRPTKRFTKKAAFRLFEDVGNALAGTCPTSNPFRRAGKFCPHQRLFPIKRQERWSFEDSINDDAAWPKTSVFRSTVNVHPSIKCLYALFSKHFFRYLPSYVHR